MMNRIAIFVLLMAVLTACTPSQQITNSWVNPEFKPKERYESIFIIAFANDINAKIAVENELAKVVESRGRKAVKSSDVFSAAFLADTNRTREQLIQAISGTGCDGVYTVALMDVKTDESYQPATVYYPVEHSFYDCYNRYAFYYFDYVEEPGYTITNRTFYFETNFYDLALDQLISSIQSDAFNPSDIPSLMKGYSKLMLAQLKKEGLIKE
jgi:hypothetical protein